MKSASRKRGGVGANIIMTLVYLFLYAPMIVMLIFSFNSTKSTSKFTSFSLKWYQEVFFGNSKLLNFLFNSILLAVVSSVIATVIGTVAAVGIYKLKSKRAEGVFKTVNNIPVMNPDIVTGVSLMMLFIFVSGLLGKTGDSTNFFTLLIAHITFNIPYVILNVLPKLRSTDPALMEAAQDLGCTPFKAFMKAVFPQLTPAIISALLMAFTLSFDDFVISYYTSGKDFNTLPVYIYTMVKKPMKLDVYAMYSVIFVTILVLLILYNVIQNRSDPVNVKQRQIKKLKKLEKKNNRKENA